MKVSLPIYTNQISFQKSYKKASFNSRKQNYKNNKNENNRPKIKKTPFVLMGMLALTCGFYLGRLSLNNQKIDFEKIKEKVKGVISKKEDDKSWLALLALAGISGYEAKRLSKEDKENIIDSIINGETPLQKASYGAREEIDNLKSNTINSTNEKYTKDFYGVRLLDENNALNRNSKKYQKAILNTQEIAFNKLTSTDKPIEISKENPVVWSVTSEFAPIKEGGLGSVPPEIRNNSTKLGIDMPTFVPMYLNNGISTFSEEDGKYIYNYKGKKIELEKMLSFKMDSYKNGNIKPVNVELYLNTDVDEDNNERKLVFIKCDNYFDGTIYETNSKTEENEKFAIMSKAVYELAKIKMDGFKASKDLKIYSNEALNKIKAPDAMILNDWQASPTAALMRYKSSFENAYGQLSDDAAQKLRDMNIIAIGHNVMYQGSSQNNNNFYQKRATASNLLNTLFDKYAYDIVSNAKVHTERIDENDEGLKVLDNALLLNYENSYDNYVNFLNMGIILSDYFCPVSKNYAQELISPKHRDLSYMLQWALVQKEKAGKLVGIINGNDFKNISIEAKAPQIKKQTNVDFKTYNKKIPQKKLMEARNKNKIDFYNKYILPFTKSEHCTDEEIEKVKNLSSLEFYEGEQGSELPLIKKEDFKNVPILSSGGRLVSQKGIDVLCDAIELLFKNWDYDFEGYEKPIFYIAGQDGEGGTQRKIIEDLKDNRLSKEDNDRVVFAHGYAPLPAIMAASDFFMIPSIFEPCGLVQSESLALGTPVIASNVGGIADTVNRDGKFNGILTDKCDKMNAEEFYMAMKEALKIYFEDKEKYQSMVNDSIKEDFSWILPDNKGPVHEYLDLLNIVKH